MKKLLALLSTISLVTTSASSIVSCSINTNFDWVAPSPEDPNDNNGQGSQLNYISIETIKKATAHIWNLSSVTEVNKELKKVAISGVQNLYAILNYGSQTDVLVSITLEDNWRVTEDVYEFEIPGAILSESVEIIEINTIKAATQGISDKKNLEEVNAELAKISLTGVKSLTGSLVSGSETDVLVTISLENGYVLDVSQPNYQIIGAIKAKIVVKTSEIQALADKIMYKNNISEVQTALDEISISGLISLTASTSSDQTSVDVAIEIDSENAKLEGASTFTIKNALKLIVNTTDVQAAVSGITNQSSVSAVQSKLNAIKIDGVKSLTASPVSSPKTSVMITITVEENVILQGNSSFTLNDALVINVSTSAIIEATSGYEPFESLQELQTWLDTINIEGLKSLTANFSEGSTTNVIVTIEVESNAVLIGAKTFTLSKAVKVKISSDEIISEIESMKNQPTLYDFRQKLVDLNLEGVTNYYISFKDGSFTDVNVLIALDVNGVIDGVTSFDVTNAVKREVEDGIEGTIKNLELIMRDAIYHSAATSANHVPLSEKLYEKIALMDETKRILSASGTQNLGPENVVTKGVSWLPITSPKEGGKFTITYNCAIEKDGTYILDTTTKEVSYIYYY